MTLYPCKRVAMKKKTCFRCKIAKSLTEFYKHRAMADGRLGKCKSCTKRDALAYRLENINRIRAYDRARGLTTKHRKKVKAAYKKRTSTKAGRKREWEKSKQYRLAAKLARATYTILWNEIKGGRIKKQPCARCGSKRKIHAHHEDYAKPLDVTWLCIKCHGMRHREINEARRPK